MGGRRQDSADKTQVIHTDVVFGQNAVCVFAGALGPSGEGQHCALDIWRPRLCTEAFGVQQRMPSDTLG